MKKELIKNAINILVYAPIPKTVFLGLYVVWVLGFCDLLNIAVNLEVCKNEKASKRGKQLACAGIFFIISSALLEGFNLIPSLGKASKARIGFGFCIAGAIGASGTLACLSFKDDLLSNLNDSEKKKVCKSMEEPSMVPAEAGLSISKFRFAAITSAISGALVFREGVRLISRS